MTSRSQVREFHSVFGHPSPESPSLNPDVSLIQLRMRLISEEYGEVMADFQKLLARVRTGKSSHDEVWSTYRDLLKELADLRYVVDGAAIALGLPIEEAFAEVHASNMSKLGLDGRPIVRDDGKVLKGPQYREADMGRIIPDAIDAEEV